MAYNIEEVLLMNIHEIMNKDALQVFGKVEITYTDTLSDPSILLEASSTAYGSAAAEVADVVESQPYKWLALHNCVLDGTFHPIAADRSVSVGWWNNELSDSYGIFSTPPSVSISFDPRSLVTLKVTGDTKINCFPTDFKITLYDSTGTLLYTKDVTNNIEVNYTVDIAPVLNVAKMTLVVYKINKANSTAKITELYTPVIEEYLADDIMRFNILEEIGYNSGGLQLGNISANEVDLVLDNVNNKFDIRNSSSILYGLLKKNRKVKVWLGVEDTPGIIDWYQQGVYWTTSWNVPNNSLVAYATARDRLELLRFTEFATSLVYTNLSLYALFEIVLIDAGLASTEYVIDNSLKDIILPYAWFSRTSHREAIQELSKCAIVNVYCNKYGVIFVRNNMQATGDVIVAYSADNTYEGVDQPLAWSNIVNYVEVVSNSYEPDVEQSVYKDTNKLVIPASSSIEVVYNFNNAPVVVANEPIISGSELVIITSYVSYAWGMVVTFYNTDDNNSTLTGVEILGKPLVSVGSSTQFAKDDALIRYDGIIKTNITHPFIQGTAYANSLATTILNTYKNSGYDIVIPCGGDIALNLGDKISFTDISTTEYMVSRQKITWDGFLSSTIEGKRG